MNLQFTAVSNTPVQKAEGVKSGSAVKSPFTPLREKNIAENRQKSKVTFGQSQSMNAGILLGNLIKYVLKGLDR